MHIYILHVYIHTHIHIHICTYVHVYTFTHVLHICIYIYVYVHLDMQPYIHIYIHTCIYIYTCVHIYTYTHRWPPSPCCSSARGPPRPLESSRARPLAGPRTAPSGPPRPLDSCRAPMEQALRGPSTPSEDMGALAVPPQGTSDDQGLPQLPPPQGPQQEEPLWHLGWDDLPLTSLGVLKAIGDPRFEFLEQSYRAQLHDLQKER